MREFKVGDHVLLNGYHSDCVFVILECLSDDCFILSRVGKKTRISAHYRSMTHVDDQEEIEHQRAEVAKIKSETPQEEYIRKQKECGLQAGDKVRVMRAADHNERGWGNPWSPTMDTFIGKVGEVCYLNPDKGVRIDFDGENNFMYPYFVLEKVESEKERAIEDVKVVLPMPPLSHFMPEEWKETKNKELIDELYQMATDACYSGAPPQPTFEAMLRKIEIWRAR